MPSYKTMTPAQITEEISQVESRYNAFCERKLQLNMTRGKPCNLQLDLSAGLMTCLAETDYRADDGTDCRNYGGLDGLPEARQLFADILGCEQHQVIVGGNSSLNLMYDFMARAMLFALPGADKPWGQQGTIRLICPCPGYDRHFFVMQDLGIEMLPVAMTPSGPDMDAVERLAASDPLVKGIWLVPVYSNPDGITCSEETCRRLASMHTAASDFRILWDNAYIVHHLNPEQPEGTPDILALCQDAGHTDRPIEFASTSKITWAGAGMACLASSHNNLSFVRKHMGFQTIGPDKMNQLRHCRFLGGYDGVKAIMARHAEILRPKFDLVLRTLQQELAETGIARWNEPKGGYFVSLFVMPGTAVEVVQLAKSCGVEVTPAGNTYPYGRDPDNANIRLAPTFPPIAELETAMEVFCTCVRLAALRRLQQQA